MDVALVNEVSCAGLQCQSPTYVCEACLRANPGAIWLAWLKCIYPDEHQSYPKVTAVVSLTGTKLVKVRQPPQVLLGLSVNQPQLCRHHRQCSWQDSCAFAHSKEEVYYWKSKIAEQHYKSLVSYSLCAMLQCQNNYKILYCDGFKNYRPSIGQQFFKSSYTTILLPW